MIEDRVCKREFRQLQKTFYLLWLCASWSDHSWTGTAGTTSSTSGEPLSADSRFRLASITKLFTATLILQLVDGYSVIPIAPPRRVIMLYVT
jgi:hypothetical protein